MPPAARLPPCGISPTTRPTPRRCVDARFDYRFDTANGGVDLFFNVNDLFDTEPEDFFSAVYSSNVAAGTGLNVTGENRGRRYTLGVRMSF